MNNDKRVPLRSGILDKPLIRPRTEVSLSAFAFLFSEMVQYSQTRASSVADLEKRLETFGYGIGQRLIEVISCRERTMRRETRLVGMLQYITNVVWKAVFGKVADNLERSMENEDEYMIHESGPVTNAFVSVPSDMGQLNCGAFIAGVINGVLDSARFNAKVTAHTVSGENGADRTVFLIKFASEVMSRERKLGAV